MIGFHFVELLIKLLFFYNFYGQFFKGVAHLNAGYCVESDHIIRLMFAEVYAVLYVIIKVYNIW